MLASPFRHTARVLCTALLAGIPAFSWAASDSELRDALAAAREQQWQRVDERSIADHPLRGYVEYHRLRGQLPNVSPDRVQQFIGQYADSPLAGWMRGQAIANYGHAGRYSDLLSVADGEPAGTARQCYYYAALLNSQPQQASAAGLELWRVGSSQPDACNPLFNSLRANGTIDATAIWERKMLAWQAGETGLSNYLDGLLSGQWQTALDTVRSVNDRSSAITQAPSCLGPECAATASFIRRPCSALHAKIRRPRLPLGRHYHHA